MAEAPFVETQLLGFFEPGFAAEGRVPMWLERGPAEGMMDPLTMPPTRVHDARHLQRESGLTCEDFFAKHGFVLLDHESAVEDWDVDPATPDAQNEVSRVYGPEVEALIRQHLLPDSQLDVWQGPPQRRGPGSPNPEYAGGVHQDFGLTPDDYQESIEVFVGPEIANIWRSRYDQDEVVGFLAIDFWRTAGMRGPLRHMPLCISDAPSIRVEDCVSMGLADFAPSGKLTNQLGLRRHPDQRWYYYPEMTPSEVLAFKQFEFWKDDPRPRSSCFHSAFALPDTPPDAEERQSTEHRVLTFLLR